VCRAAVVNNDWAFFDSFYGPDQAYVALDID